MWGVGGYGGYVVFERERRGFVCVEEGGGLFGLGGGGGEKDWMVVVGLLLLLRGKGSKFAPWSLTANKSLVSKVNLKKIANGFDCVYLTMVLLGIV